MVSIHDVPVAVILIISIVCFMFRFKREASHCCSLHVMRLVGIALSVETSNVESPTPICMIHLTLCMFLDIRIHQRLYSL